MSIEALEHAAADILNGRADTEAPLAKEVLQFSDPGPSSPRPSSSTQTTNGPSSPTAGPSSTPAPCSLCSIPSKYTCPGCNVRTCSLQCSKSHKANTGCSGERNKVAYVPMKEYTWGSMMNDYVFLEEVGRRVGEVGKEIVQGGYSAGGSQEWRGRGRGTSMRGRGAGRDRGRGGGKTKRDLLKMQLEVRDVDVEFLPVGMKRRKANQSSWDYKKQTALLTLEFKFHKPLDPLAPSGTLPDPPLVFLTHRNLCSNSLLSILQGVVKDRVHNAPKRSKQPPEPPTNGASTSTENANTKQSLEWLETLTIPSAEDPEGFTPPICVLRAPLDPLLAASSLAPPQKHGYASVFQPQQPKNPGAKKAYFKLDLDQPLLTSLKNTQFVEFPTVEVYDPMAFKGMLVDRDGRVNVVAGEDEEREGPYPNKRRKLNKREGKKKIGGLLGGYGSGSEEDEEDEKEKRNVLSMLGEYSDSDGGVEDSEIVEGDKEAENDPDVSLDDEDEGEADPARLMELLKKVKAETLGVAVDEDEEVLDWDDGDLSDADAEGEDDPDEGEEVEYYS